MSPMITSRSSRFSSSRILPVRPGVMKKNAFDAAKSAACQLVKPAVALTEDDIQTEVLEVVKAAKKLVDLIGADFIVSVGRGISKDVEKGIQLATDLANELGGVVGGSRATIDSGWLSADHQVGQTGKTVHPKVYVALGISGAIQHKAGMQDSECIIAVNKNDTAPSSRSPITASAATSSRSLLCSPKLSERLRPANKQAFLCRKRGRLQP